jgi:hypothetical protein
MTLEIVHALHGHQSKILSVTFDIGFKKLTSLGKDRSVRIW